MLRESSLDLAKELSIEIMEAEVRKEVSLAEATERLRASRIHYGAIIPQPEAVTMTFPGSPAGRSAATVPLHKTQAMHPRSQRQMETTTADKHGELLWWKMITLYNSKQEVRFTLRYGQT